MPRCILIAGPNGSGKITLARRYLPEDEGVFHFVNADLIASGLSPLKPELAGVRAGRLVSKEIERLAGGRADFAFETTLSGLGYVRRMRAWKRAGCRIEIVYLKLQSTRLAVRRIAGRVRVGGHDVPRPDVIRRFARGWENFTHVYRPLADIWTVYDNSGPEPRLLESGRMVAGRIRRTPLPTAANVGRALRRAAKDARRTARMHGVPIYIWEGGRVVARNP